MYRRFLKRCLDVAAALAGLAVLSPLLLALWLLVRRRLGSPVLFRQERPGKNGRLFLLRKFRTMTDGRDGDGKLLPDEERLTPFGAWLRATSLDELPELFNILRGDMSVVGPRPLLPRYLPRYSPEQARRHQVRPGLTGWAQVNGRNALSWEDKFAMDVWYADHLSFATDARIFFKTVRAVIKREGISQEGAATMEEFMGSDRKGSGLD